MQVIEEVERERDDKSLEPYQHADIASFDQLIGLYGSGNEGCVQSETAYPNPGLLELRLSNGTHAPKFTRTRTHTHKHTHPHSQAQAPTRAAAACM